MGMDRAQPGSKLANRTFLPTVAKGRLPNEEDKRLEWLYFILRLTWIPSSEIKDIRTEIEDVENCFGTIDNICLEQYLAADVGSWLEEKEIDYEMVFPNYKNQYVAFTMMWQLMENGLLKCPDVPYYRMPGTSEITLFPEKDDLPDLFREELEVFDHDTGTRVFGSPYKKKGKKKEEEDGELAVTEKILDDSVFGTAWAIHAGRNIWQGTPRGNLYSNFGGVIVKAGRTWG